MMKEVEAMIDELKRFSSDIATLNEPVDPKKLEDFELKYDVELPADYKQAMMLSNGFSIMGDEIYGLYGLANPTSLESVYEREHYEVAHPQFPYLVPFIDDGGGNFYCFDTKTNDTSSCKVVFWVSNYSYSDTDAPEIVYPSFIALVNEVLIAWTLRDYDYDGNEK